MDFKPGNSITIEGLNINYKIIGKGSENLLLLHGFLLSTESWDFILGKFDSTKFRMICVDILGFGFSDKPLNSDYSIERQSKLIQSFLTKLHVDTLTIISHSYGGVIALYLTYLSLIEENNLKIKKEILIDVPAFSGIKPKFINVLKNDFLSFLSLKILPEKVLAKYILKTTFFDYPKAKNSHLDRYTFFLRKKNIDEAIVQMAKQLLPKKINDLMNSYKLIDFPVLIIWGNNDNLIKIENGKRLHNEVKTSKLVIIPNCGHVPHEECPDETFNEIHKFLERE